MTYDNFLGKIAIQVHLLVLVVKKDRKTQVSYRPNRLRYSLFVLPFLIASQSGIGLRNLCPLKTKTSPTILYGAECHSLRVHFLVLAVKIDRRNMVILLSIATSKRGGK